MLFQLSVLGGLLLLIGAGTVTLARAERRAAQLTRMQREFVAAVSHELRTPLTTLRMHAELLREGWIDEASRARFYDDLVVESTRLGQLVDNVLALSRLERGRSLTPRDGDLGTAVSEAAEKRRRFVELKGFSLAVDTGSAPAVFDPDAVDTIVANLLDNAVKYGGGEQKQVRVSVRRDGRRAVLSVADQGAGIPATEAERVFEQFYRTNTTAAPGTGTGIGLALVRRLTREQGGEARVAQTARGCMIEIALPSTPG